jgi:hypothetical protein
MPVTLNQVVDHVAAMEPETDRKKISATVRETIMAIGLPVDSRTGEVYSPAPPPSNVPKQRNVRWYGGRRR